MRKKSNLKIDNTPAYLTTISNMVGKGFDAVSQNPVAAGAVGLALNWLAYKAGFYDPRGEEETKEVWVEEKGHYKTKLLVGYYHYMKTLREYNLTWLWTDWNGYEHTTNYMWVCKEFLEGSLPPGATPMNYPTRKGNYPGDVEHNTESFAVGVGWQYQSLYSDSPLPDDPSSAPTQVPPAVADRIPAYKYLDYVVDTPAHYEMRGTGMMHYYQYDLSPFTLSAQGINFAVVSRGSESTKITEATRMAMYASIGIITATIGWAMAQKANYALESKMDIASSLIPALIAGGSGGAGQAIPMASALLKPG